MAYSGETLDLTRSAENAPKPANESGGLLKAAANFAKGKLPEMAAAPAAKPGAANGKRTSVMSINVEMAGTSMACSTAMSALRPSRSARGDR
jgi:hypothetical protein